MNDCKNCKFIGEDNEDEFSHVWWICSKTSYHYLKSFPFKNTKCSKFIQREQPYQESHRMGFQKFFNQ